MSGYDAIDFAFKKEFHFSSIRCSRAGIDQLPFQLFLVLSRIFGEASFVQSSEFALDFL